MKPSLIAITFLFFVSFPSQSAALSLESCAAIKDPDERLACYDTLAGRLPADTAKAGGTAPGAVDPPAPMAEAIASAAPAAMPAAPAVEPAPDAEAIFGLEHKQKPEEERPDELKFTWTQKKKDAYGRWVIIMENGQVWRQTDSTHFTFRDPDQLVVVTRGFASSFFLSEPDRNKRIRVKRIK